MGFLVSVPLLLAAQDQLAGFRDVREHGAAQVEVLLLLPALRVQRDEGEVVRRRYPHHVQLPRRVVLLDELEVLRAQAAEVGLILLPHVAPLQDEVVAVQALQDLRQVVVRVALQRERLAHLPAHVQEDGLPVDVQNVGEHGVAVDAGALDRPVVLLELVERGRDGLEHGAALLLAVQLHVQVAVLHEARAQLRGVVDVEVDLLLLGELLRVDRVVDVLEREHQLLQVAHAQAVRDGEVGERRAVDAPHDQRAVHARVARLDEHREVPGDVLRDVHVEVHLTVQDLGLRGLLHGVVADEVHAVERARGDGVVGALHVEVDAEVRRRVLRADEQVERGLAKVNLVERDAELLDLVEREVADGQRLEHVGRLEALRGDDDLVPDLLELLDLGDLVRDRRALGEVAALRLRQQALERHGQLHGRRDLDRPAEQVLVELATALGEREVVVAGHRTRAEHVLVAEHRLAQLRDP
mmetsp:Transcript_20946/g.42203  ORF Transcript_20946/g.42203 Transcript_20946/m.42203 type:complete len:469 (+) Transcript_20946:185-1591(+)